MASDIGGQRFAVKRRSIAPRSDQNSDLSCNRALSTQLQLKRSSANLAVPCNALPVSRNSVLERMNGCRLTTEPSLSFACIDLSLFPRLALPTPDPKETYHVDSRRISLAGC